MSYGIGYGLGYGWGIEESWIPTYGMSYSWAAGGLLDDQHLVVSNNQACEV
jgi:hypothetical protein